MLATSLCRFYGQERDCLWIEIPVERHPSIGDKTIHSEILITQKKELANIKKNQPHIDKILYNIEPSSGQFDSKKESLIILGEN
jgi:hypothetical protein